MTSREENTFIDQNYTESRDENTLNRTSRIWGPIPHTSPSLKEIITEEILKKNAGIMPG